MAKKEKRDPQKSGSIVYDPAGSCIGIWTPDGRSVLMVPALARDMALHILEITETTVHPGDVAGSMRRPHYIIQ